MNGPKWSSRRSSGVGVASGGGAGVGRSGRISMAMRAVQAYAAGSQFFGQDRAQFEGRTQFHVHRGGEMVFGEQGKAGAVDALLPEVLQDEIKFD